jgi:Rod binding domain-containing protein
MSNVSSIGSAQTIDPNALRDMLNRQGASANKIHQTGVQFEAILVRQFLGDALKPSIKGSLDEDDQTADTYRYFINDILSQSLASRGVFGIGKQIEAQLTSREAAMGYAKTTDEKTEVKATGTACAIKSQTEKL